MIDKPNSPAEDNGPDPTPVNPVVRKKGKPKSATRNMVEWLVVIVAAVVLAIVIKTYVVQAFRIPSESMSPTLMVGDRVLVNKLSYDAHNLNRGDVVVFTRPPGLPASPGDPDDLIKRVIALPGESVVAKDGSIFIDDKKLSEPYLKDSVETYNLDNPVTVPKGQVWVMGDNRMNSEDSRFFGPIDSDTIVGRAFMIMWPPGRIGAL
ncbi:MAG TPA: signal peptidase I [Microthrixaceae bacterium]|nr:signal peptidase I [Microthrixaceae bacterium]